MGAEGLVIEGLAVITDHARMNVVGDEVPFGTSKTDARCS